VIASQSIHNFWFEELPAKQHFVKDTALEATITHRNAILVRTGVFFLAFAFYPLGN
jgi:hypothetical protein